MKGAFTERIQANAPAWAHEQLVAWDTAEFAAMSDFITEHYWTGQGSINVYRIVGTDHPQYAGMSWLELLERGKRMDINIPLLEKNPGQSNSMPGWVLSARMAFTGMSVLTVITAAVWPAFCSTCRVRGAHSFTMWPRVFITQTRCSGLPVGKFTTWQNRCPGMMCIFVCRSGGSVFPAKTWPAGKWIVSEQRRS